MEFKFRAVDNRPPNYFSSSSSSTFNYMSGQAFRPNSNFIRNRFDPVQWELEKAQIREEIIASEIARRRALEAEVRRELMAEREMVAMHGPRETGLSFDQRLRMRLDPRRPFMHHFNNHHLWRPEERFDLFRPPLPPAPPPPPPVMLPPRVTEVEDTEVKATSERNKNKLIILAKPDPNRVVGAKWKTPPLASTGELPPHLISSNKKHEEEWSCAICQVSTTSEKGLTEHLQGRKHKAKKERLRAQRMEKNSYTNTTALPKKPRKHAKVAGMPVNTGLGSETMTDEKLPPLNKNVDGSDQKLEDRDNLKNKKDDLLIQKKKKKKAERLRNKLESLRKKYGPVEMEKVEKTPELRINTKFKFWCQICLVGAYSEVVMETHNKGKRHIARLQALNEISATAPATTITDTVTEQASSDGTQMPKDTDVVANEANEKLMDVMVADGCIPSPVVN